jgi:CheY-like chemotaxis protein
MALAALAGEKPDLILLDIQMPDMNGYEVCRRLKGDEALCGIPVIFLSAFSETDDKVRAFKDGGVDYITKPFAAVEVLARTLTHLRLRRHQVHLEELVSLRVRELEEANRRLRLWDEAKAQWLNTLSHEMRTPLVAIFAITEILLMNAAADPDHAAFSRDFDVSRERIEKLIDDALTLSALDISANPVETAPVQLGVAVERALKTVLAQSPGLPVAPSLHNLEGAIVRGDPNLLNRALVDLLLTAAQCVAAGNRLRLEGSAADGTARLAIAIGGKTLPAEALETFFEVGGQRILLKSGGDFGLGAALSSRIFRLFGGTVSVSNHPEKGLLLELSLPVQQPLSSTGVRLT